jgi:lysophospholipase L1-like esterase
MRFLALGDSYTVGECVPPERAWPAQLVELLRADGIPLAEPEVIAQTGWTTDELMAGIDEKQPEGLYDLVTLLIGVNDQYRGRDVEAYRTGFAQLLKQAIGFTGGDATRVIVLSIPDWGITPFAATHDRKQVAAEIDAYNDTNRQEAQRMGTAYIDVTSISRTEAAGFVAEDGLHPSGVQYAAWAQIIKPAARKALRG